MRIEHRARLSSLEMIGGKSSSSSSLIGGKEEENRLKK
jgi:hypothetical protein